MHRREFVLSATGILGATTVGSMAYTSASVTRSVSANVNADANAIIELTANSKVDSVTNNNNQLTIDVTEALNQKGTFKYGNYLDPSSTPAFTITNQDGSARSISVSIDDPETTVSLKLDTPTGKAEVTDGNSVNSISLDGTTNGAQSIDVAVKIDTAGVSTGTDAIDANITIDAA